MIKKSLLFTALSFLFSFLSLNAQVDIDGPLEVCANDCTTYSISNGAGGPYLWSFTGATPSYLIGEEATVCWFAYSSGDIEVYDSADMSTTNLTIDVIDSPSPELILPAFPSCQSDVDCDGFTLMDSLAILNNDCYDIFPGSVIQLNPLANDEILIAEGPAGFYYLQVESYSSASLGDLVNTGEPPGPIYGPENCGVEIITYEACLYLDTGGGPIGVLVDCATATIYINIDCDSTNELPPPECLKVCPNSTGVYTVSTDVGTTLDWEVTDITNYTIDDNEITVEWGTDESGVISFTETNPNGCSTNEVVCVEVLEEPIAAFTTNPPPSGGVVNLCLGQTLYFENLSTNAESFAWDFGNDDLSGDFEPVYEYMEAGTYEVSLVATSGCYCTNSTSLTVVVGTETVPEILCTGTVCQGDMATYYSASTCASYDWVVSGGIIVDGGGSTDDFVSVQWNNGGVGNVELALSACAGVCDLAVVEEIPIIGDDINIEGPTEVCTDGSEVYSVPLFQATSYYWQVVGSGYITSGQNSNQIVVDWVEGLNSGTAEIIVSYDNCYLDCGGEDTLVVNLKPKFGIGGDIKACLGNNTYLNTTIINGWTSVDCDWSVTLPDGTVDTDFVLDESFISYQLLDGEGLYRFEAVATDPAAWCNETAVLTVEALPQPPPLTGIEGTSNICLDHSYIYEAFSDTPANDVMWIVQNDGLTLFQAGNPLEITWTGAGPHELAAIQRFPNPPYCMSDTLYFDINLLSGVNINGDTEVCADQVSIFTAEEVDLEIYEWEVNPASAGTIINGGFTNEIEVLWHQEGPATVELVLCEFANAFNVTVLESAKPAVPNAAVCAGEIANVSTTTPYATYEWKDEDGLVLGNGPNINLTGGHYEVSVVNADGCEGRTSFFVEEYPIPEINISTPDPKGFCPPAADRNLIALDTEDGYTYQWYHDNIMLPGETGPILSTSDFGDYYVAIVDINGCTNSSNVITLFEYCVEVPFCNGPNCPIPTPACVPDGSIGFDVVATSNCNEFNFVNTSVNYIPGTVEWVYTDIEDNYFTANTINFNHIYDEPGYYVVFLVLDVPDVSGTGSCTLVTAEVIEVGAVADFENETVCADNPMSFIDLSTVLPNYTITDWSWDFDDPASGVMNSSALSNPVHIFSSPGMYNVTLEITTDQGCTNEITKEVEVLAPIDVSFTADPITCEGTSLAFTLDSTTDVVTIDWNFDDPTSGAANTASMASTYHVFENSGFYDVAVSVTDVLGCTTTHTQTIQVEENNLALGNIALSEALPICEGETVDLIAPLGFSYQWSTDQTTQTITVSNSGYYSVTISDDNNCLFTPNPIFVSVEPKPIASIYANEVDEFGSADWTNNIYESHEMCEGDELILYTNWGINNTYEWSNPNGLDQSFLSLEGENTLTVGIHTFTVTITNTTTTCSSVSDPFTVIVNPNPADFWIEGTTPEPYCEGDATTLNVVNPQAGINYHWNNGVIGTSITVSSEGLYYATATNEWGCRQNSSNHINIHPLPNVNLIPTGCLERCNPDTLCIISDGNTAFQWYLDGTAIAAPEGTTPNLIINQDGEYHAELSNAYGCTTTSDVLSITLTAGIGDITGSVFNDDNEDGIWDTGETGVSNVEVYLIVGPDTLATTLTDANGLYAFNNVVSQAYNLSINEASLPAGSSLTSPLEVPTELIGCDDANEAIWGVSICPIDTPQPFTFETCEGSTYTYDADELAIGSVTDYTYTSQLGCDSTVTITIVGLPSQAEQVELQTCTGVDAIFDGVIIPIGETEVFTYTNQLGCDSIITVNVIEVAQITNELFLETCLETTVAFEDTVLAIGSVTEFTYPTLGGCDSILTVTIDPLPDLFASLNTQESCWNSAEGWIELSNINGGSAPFEFSLDGYTYQSDSLFTNLSEGDYTVYMMDAQGCIKTFDTSIDVIEPLAFNLQDRFIPCSENSVVLDLPMIFEGDSIPLQYLWQDGSVNSTYTATQAGTYTVEVSNTCESVTASINVTAEESYSENPFVTPNAFSPNGDGLNDDFHPIVKAGINIINYEFQVFDRWGKKLYMSTDTNRGWQGDFAGEEMTLGVYVWFYKATIESCGETKDVFGKGNISLIR